MLISLFLKLLIFHIYYHTAVKFVSVRFNVLFIIHSLKSVLLGLGPFYPLSVSI